ncbi:MAG TPA: DUF2948 family protein [Parvularculaceae bacterium]|nr:DUF2948 family protein [Parvularculaceae bacterium]
MSDLRDYKPLRLMAADAEDLGVFSAYLQDAVAKVGDFVWLAAERRFAFVANRFLWELAKDGKKGPFWRARIGAHFDDVKSVKQLNIKADVKDAIVELLALRFEPGADGGGVIVLDFAGAGAIRLEVDAINGEMRDLAGPWRTRTRPAHAI